MSDPLREFNREDWTDKPFLIRLVGGQADGKSVLWHELPRIWQQVLPPPVSLLLDPDPDAGFGPCIAHYYETGSVADDGAHLYEFRGTS